MSYSDTDKKFDTDTIMELNSTYNQDPITEANPAYGPSAPVS